jgi:uncharacterized protein YggT (Ycf19 family)
MSWMVRGLDGLRVVVLVDALLSWGMPREQFPRSLTSAMFDPVYGPIRSVLQPFTGSVDVSPIIALLVLYVVKRLLQPASTESLG